MRIRTLIWTINSVVFAIILIGIVSAFSYPVEAILRANARSQLDTANSDICTMVRAVLRSSIESALRAHAETAIALAKSYERRHQNGEFSRDEAQQRAERALLGLTFGKTGYYYCLNSQGIVVLHPQISIKGSSVTSFPFILEQMRRKNGYLEYSWKNPDEPREFPKALYMRYFEPWDWVISATSYRQDFIHLVNTDLFRNELVNMKYGSRGYSTIINASGVAVIHPFLEGKNLLEVNEGENRILIQGVLASKTGEMTYSWRNPEDRRAQEKIALFKFLPEFDWIVVSTFYLEDVIAPLNGLKRTFWVLTLISLVVIFAVNFALGTLISRPILRVVTYVRSVSENLSPEAVPHSDIVETRVLAESFQQMGIQLRKTLSLLAGTFEAAPSPLIILDESGEILKANAAASAFFTTRVPELEKQNFWVLFPRFSGFQGLCAEILKSGQAKTLLRERIVTTEGAKARVLTLAFFPIQVEGKNVCVWRLDDVTEETVKEQALQQAQKMEAIGMLAGGLSHDFNNALSGVVGVASLLELMTATGNLSMKDLKDNLKILMESAQKATELSRQLLSLTRKTEIALQSSDLNLIVKSVVSICQKTFDRCVEVKPTFCPRPAQAMVSGNQIEQVLLNLLINGYHAMTLMRGEQEKPGGILAIRIEEFHAEPEFCRHNPEAAAGWYWNIAIRDQGVGMSEETRKNLFSPFFTTKKAGVGTGLGLLMVYNIVQQHKGFLKVYSERNVGSTFHIFLPALENSLVPESPIDHVPVPRGQGMIMVIDDEPMVRQTAHALLLACGYTPLIFDSAAEAIDEFARRPLEVRAVVLDVIMPRLSGKEVFGQLRRIAPDLPVLFSSGYTHEERLEDALGSGHCAFIEKPFSLEKLAKALQKLLAESSPG
jgi:signal transduction histidine kinase/ActR/RegA family two-component response regulator